MSVSAIARNLSPDRTVFYRNGTASIPPGLAVPVDQADMSQLLSYGLDFLHISHPNLLSTIAADDEDCPLTDEQLTALHDAGIHTRSELQAATDDALVAIPTIGKATVQHIRDWLSPEQG